MSSVIVALIEVAVLHLWATGRLRFTALPGDAWYSHAATLVWLFSMPYWRIAHFWGVHRFMHKWNTKSVPDFGEWMYRNVHSLHHASKNPTAFSGVAMHPVEAFLYYTASFVPLLFAAHPLVFLYTKVDLTVAALIGHSGFEFPGAGSQPHYLHHLKVDCNYAENYFPLDHWLGTFAADEDDFMKNIWPRFKPSKEAASASSQKKKPL